MIAKTFASLLALPLFCAVLTAQDAPKVETVTFAKGGFTAGDRITASNSMKMKTTVEYDGGGESGRQEFGITADTLVKTLVRDAADARPTLVDVSFEKADMKMEMPEEVAAEMGMQPDNPMAGLVGKTFRVDVRGDAPKVTLANGEEASASDVEVLKTAVIGADGKLSGLGSEITDLVPAGEMPIGHVIEVDGKTMKDVFDFGGDEAAALDPEMINAKLTLTGTRKVLGADCGVFKMVVTIEGAMQDFQGMPGEMKFSGKPEGEILIGLANRRIYRTNMEGAVNASMSMDMGEMGAFEISNRSDMNMSSFSVYDRVDLDAEKAAGEVKKD